MERKRKLPPRAAARQEQAAKRRNVSTRQSSTPAVAEPPPREPTPSPTPPPPPPPALPKSIEVGKPLPTVEEPQPTNLSCKEYQSVSESGVMSESLSRSRHKWISEGLFEKFWTKPHKRKGVLQEDPNNPPKDSMMKVGLVTLIIEPHIIEATMYAVKTSKLLPHQQQRFKPNPQPAVQEQATQTGQPQQPTVVQPQPQQQPHPNPSAAAQQPVLARPVLQYGPPNGAMRPPPTPTSPVTTTPTSMATPAASAPNSTPVETVPVSADSASATPTSVTPVVPKSSSPALPAVPPASSPASAAEVPVKVTASPNPGPPSVAKPAQSSAPQQGQPQAQSQGLVASTTTPAPASKPSQHFSQPQSTAPIAGGAHSPASTAQTPLQPAGAPQLIARPAANAPTRQAVVSSPAAGSPSSTSSRPAGTPNQAQPPAPSSRPAAAPAPAAKPAANDPVIALLAQKASADPELRDLMKRVAVGQAKDGELAKFQKIIDQLNAEYRQRGGQQGPSADRLLVDGRTVKYFADEVRTILDIVLASNPNQKSSELRPPPRSDPLVVLLVKTALENQRIKDMIRRIAEGKPGFTDATDLKQTLDRLHRDAKITPKAATTPGPSPLRQPPVNGPTTASQPKAQAPQGAPQANQQMKSKAPSHVNRPDISAVVFDFGSGDRYLFPRFSILEFLPAKSGQHVVASFLIVRKGSASEYGGDPKLDYYQPVTIRLQTTTGRHLENLARVVAPQDEVRRYMDDVMDNMTRAEYVLLAMRLPRADFDPEEVVPAAEDSKASSPTPKSEPETDNSTTPKPGVLWTTGSNNKATVAALPVKLQDPEQEAQSKYERLIRSVAEKEVDGL
ncbi:hypothetical protein J3459_015785 [Metarhizium acridum]|uniref:SWR1-complex protein 3 domain-containing protein n=1 Tax=Metarhizium acridum (strain CQMa 102) TaxID=655827 RepID=E9EFZ9_METAQ|nr:uncharacterized protein MAC_08797 [Metarhizium acridum CQMa 102]EFY85179.1 hypothetical protein MAC_08797 [Metarhizium acridum CQMa 102]KAG8411471.1 hypothetical protein J3458_015528 [Metarhizium acridum]KAG8413105.1 hypothetical protein J3459_015785 [Metarhizium acridum]